MTRDRDKLSAVVGWLTGRQAGRAGRLALVIGAHLLVAYLLLRVPEVRSPVKARLQSLQITFFGAQGQPAARDLGVEKPKLARLKVTVPPLPEERITDVPVAAATLHTPAVRSDSPVAAAPSAPARGARIAVAQSGLGVGPAALGASDHGIVVVSRVAPSYPPRALRTGERGTVIIALQVDPQGRLSQVRVLRSSGSRDLDRAAAAAVGRWKFRAAAKSGQSIGAWGRVQVNFYVICGSSPRPDRAGDAPKGGCSGRSAAAARRASPQR